jgi:phage terminase large subunit-like protein
LADLDAILAGLQQAVDLRQHSKIRFFKPYPKQEAFFEMGATMRERLLLAGNQLGKSEAGAYEVACHLTGRYPSWWKGRKFDHPVKVWACSESSGVVRDVAQSKLCGHFGVTEDFGTGYIPKGDFTDTPSTARGVTDAYDMIQVRHHNAKGEPDGTSTCSFKSYEQGRLKFQGTSIDVAWMDEECPMDIYSEILTRTTATHGMVFTTFTPMKGPTAVVNRFIVEKSPERGMVTMTIYDALHFTEEERKQKIADYPAHEREARAMGVPILGSGRIFSYADETITENPLTYVPQHWVKIWGIDFGIDHPFAASLILWDKDADVIHVHYAFRMSGGLPINHVAAMKPVGAAVPVAWPHDGDNREKSTGVTLITSYQKAGLRTLGQHATWEDGGLSTEAGVLEMQQRMTTNRFKVNRTLMQGDFGEEFRFYHRKDGLIVKERDDIISATRIAIMAKRFAQPVQLGGKIGNLHRKEVADDVDFDLWGG